MEKKSWFYLSFSFGTALDFRQYSKKPRRSIEKSQTSQSFLEQSEILVEEILKCLVLVNTYFHGYFVLGIVGGKNTFPTIVKKPTVQ